MKETDILDEALPWCAVEGTDLVKILKHIPIKIPSILRDYWAYFAAMTRNDVEYLLTTNWEILQ